MKQARGRSVVGWVLAGLGIATILMEFAFYWYYRLAVHQHYDIDPWVMLGGAALGFVGFYMLDPKGAKDGGGFLVESAEGLIAVARAGRRATDRVIAQPVPLTQVPAEHLPDPIVTEEHDG